MLIRGVNLLNSKLETECYLRYLHGREWCLWMRSRLMKISFVEEPIEIVERDVKKLKRIRIPLVKVRWNSRQGAELWNIFKSGSASANVSQILMAPWVVAEFPLNLFLSEDTFNQTLYLSESKDTIIVAKLNHDDEVPVVEPNQHNDVSVVLEPVLEDEDEDPKEDEFEEE
ncbi:hypothetical protein Tco_0451229 [Tanacetum coccineum]